MTHHNALPYDTDHKTFWIGQPNPDLGRVFYERHQARKTANTKSVYVLLAEVGKRGGQWGTMYIDLQDAVYHYAVHPESLRALVENHALTEEGTNSVARGVRGAVSTKVDWKWVQRELDITPLISATNRKRLITQLQNYLHNEREPPRYQGYNYALKQGVTIDSVKHNCSSFVASHLDIRAPKEIERLPTRYFDYLASLL